MNFCITYVIIINYFGTACGLIRYSHPIDVTIGVSMAMDSGMEGDVVPVCAEIIAQNGAILRDINANFMITPADASKCNCQISLD